MEPNYSGQERWHGGAIQSARHTWGWITTSRGERTGRSGLGPPFSRENLEPRRVLLGPALFGLQSLPSLIWNSGAAPEMYNLLLILASRRIWDQPEAFFFFNHQNILPSSAFHHVPRQNVLHLRCIPPPDSSSPVPSSELLCFS